MLAIVHHSAGGGVRERARSPAQVRFLLEQPHASASAGQSHSRRQARQPPAHNEHVISHAPTQRESRSRVGGRVSSSATGNVPSPPAPLPQGERGGIVSYGFTLGRQPV